MRADSALGEHPADVVRLAAVTALVGLPDLDLPRMVRADGEGHQHLEGHRVLGVSVEKVRRDGRELEALLHHARRDEESCGDLVLRNTGKPIARVVEEALEDYTARLGAARSAGALDRAYALAAADRAHLPPNTTSDTAEFYDAEGMPL